ncbi:hypothetical protein PT07_00165 [Pseudomonas phage PT07]|nr:hypothetical protein PT07_00165 [Pseudomonas phage PT07]
MDASVYAPFNQCKMMGLERTVRSLAAPNGCKVVLYQDHKNKHRIVIYDALGHGMSGVMVQADGEIHYKETRKASQGQNLTRQLQAQLTAWGVKWFPSQYQTTAGAACYKGDR